MVLIFAVSLPVQTKQQQLTIPGPSDTFGGSMDSVEQRTQPKSEINNDKSKVWPVPLPQPEIYIT